jgi:ribose/xylose/arabinose/galactoside ABC-type transport system permease subunit
VCAFGASRYAEFPTPENLLNVLRQNSMLGLAALGMTFVVLTGGIDLSVGALVAVSGWSPAGRRAPGRSPRRRPASARRRCSGSRTGS